VKTDLRAHLQAHIAGEVAKPRGNALTQADVKKARAFSRACAALHHAAWFHNGDDGRISAPPKHLPPLP